MNDEELIDGLEYDRSCGFIGQLRSGVFGPMARLREGLWGMSHNQAVFTNVNPPGVSGGLILW